MSTAAFLGHCTCRERTAGLCPACAPEMIVPLAKLTAPADAVTIQVTVPIEEAMRRVAGVIREFAALEHGPVRERLIQVAEAVEGSNGTR